MCGIFGLFAIPEANVDGRLFRRVTDQLFQLSESRGREASGVAIRYGNDIWIYKQPLPGSELIRSDGYQRLLENVLGCGDGGKLGGPIAIIGHTRLVTNGIQTASENNQPVVRGGVIGVHNGIIVNEEDLWATPLNARPNLMVDTEVLLALLEMFTGRGMDVPEAVQRAFTLIRGSASLAALFDQTPAVALATNTGSLYYCRTAVGTVIVAASERYILQRLARGALRGLVMGKPEIRPLRAGAGLLVSLSDLSTTTFSLNTSGNQPHTPPSCTRSAAAHITDLAGSAEQYARKLRRCTRCILPSTMPFIRFDESGVCNYCRSAEPEQLSDTQAIARIVEPYRSRNGEPDCLVAVSGGRDSCYGLYYLKEVLHMNPIAFTYDWGMVTDLARRNQARVCGDLGIEHIVVSADIRRKRANIKKNVEAWLRRPHLGMVPLFTAGDKMFYYHANELAKRNGIPLIVFCENRRFEQTRFKSGFCGVNEGNRRLFNLAIREKLKLAMFYGTQFLLNPRYINTSLWDSALAYLASYFLKHDYLFLFDYVEWREEKVVHTLREKFDWEVATDTSSTWRIGDGTAAFYNYIYYTVAGFTENDTFRSNQVRAGHITRDDALALAFKENKPRWESLYAYARTAGFDPDRAIQTINAVPRLSNVA